MNSKLNRLFKKYKSDKYEHRYSEVYDNFFLNLKDKKLKILEIGVADGSSIKAWSDFFKKSTIFGMWLGGSGHYATSMHIQSGPQIFLGPGG